MVAEIISPVGDTTEIIPARPFNPWRCASSHRFMVYVRGACSELAAHEQMRRSRKRARTSLASHAFTRQFEAIVSDVVHAALETRPGLLVPRSKRRLGNASRYKHPIVEVESLCRTLDTMQEVGFIDMKVGEFGFLTEIKPGPRLRIDGWTFDDLSREPGGELLLLKDRKRYHGRGGALIEYTDDVSTLRMRAEIANLNASLWGCDLALTDGAQTSGYDLHDRTLRRIFNNGSFTLGGRLFGGFWQRMRKQERLTLLRIEGEPIAEVDYGQMFARLLYGKAGVTPPPGDLYRVAGLEDHRAGVKLLLISLLFKEAELQRCPADTRPLLPLHLSAKEAVGLIARAHPAIASYFGKGVGFELMYEESEILLEVLDRCRGRHLHALPIHDAVLVPASWAEIARGIMVEVFRERVGLEGVVSISDSLLHNPAIYTQSLPLLSSSLWGS